MLTSLLHSDATMNTSPNFATLSSGYHVDFIMNNMLALKSHKGKTYSWLVPKTGCCIYVKIE